MFDRKKIAAFVAGLLLCAYGAAPAASFADNEAETTAAAEAIEPTEGAPDGDYIISGDFMYTKTVDGDARIENCTAAGTSLVIPDTIDGLTVAALGTTAFGDDMENNTFTSIEIPASVNYISANNPFIYCSVLTEIKVAENSKYFAAEDGVLYDKDKKTLVAYPAKKEGKSFTVPEGVTSIYAGGLYDADLSELKLPSTLEEVNYFAFGDMKFMEKIDMSGTSLTDLGSYAFSQCKNLSEVLLPDTLENIGGAAFSGCKSLESITLPENLISIGQYAFVDTGLKEIDVPDSVVDIGYCAFGYSTSKTGEFVADSDFTIIGSTGSAAQMYAVDSDSDYEYVNNFDFLTREAKAEQGELLSLEQITSGDFVYAITDNGAVLLSCQSTDAKVTVPEEIDGNRIVKIYPTCFSACQASEIILPESIDEIREMAFYGCPNLTSISIPASVKTIGNNAFDKCSVLSTVEIKGAETMGELVFCDCKALKKLTLSGELKEWNDDEPFVDCPNLEEITVTDGSGNFSSQDGVLYNKDKSTLVAYPAGKTDKSFTAPKSVKEIAQSAFYKAVNLESVDLSSVKTVNAFAFENCENLKKIKFTKNLTTLGSDALYNCKSLKKLRLPKSLTDIGACAFGYIYQEKVNSDNPEDTNALLEGFRLYAPKNSTAHKYAKGCGMDVVTGTVELFGKNYDVRLLGFLGALILAFIAVLIGKKAASKAKAKKAEKELAEKREKAAQRRKKQAEEAEEDDDEDEDEDDDDTLDLEDDDDNDDADEAEDEEDDEDKD
jgi:hypothetical protein